ncbi:SLAP domain-containing protein [Companilactobacillus tucceti]|uniref:SLAP domain-containing protein n=1 Tax=Companilactobacillus tucceti TaxID=238012 RepID=UPI00070C247B|nr:SLAP domain-containing protein [Companilactobacillus tucceti]
MEKSRARHKINKILLATPFLVIGGIVGIDQDIVKADVTPQVDTANTDISTNYIATSNDYGKIGGENGSDWTIDSNGVLRIQSGTWNDESVAKFWSSLKSDDGSNINAGNKITSVIFEGNIITGNSLASLFDSLENLKSVTVALGAKFDTSKTEDFQNMFSNDSSLESIDMHMFNWENVTSSLSMFYQTGLKSVDMTNINAPKLSDASSMFYNCKSLKSAKFDGTNFSKDGVKLPQFLASCSDLADVSLQNSFTGKITDTSLMFDGDINLEDLDVSSMNLSSDTKTSFMFQTSNNVQDIRRKSITLPADPNITNSKIDEYNTDRYKGWSSNLSGDIVPSLETYYSNNANVGKTTWTLVEKDKSQYKVNYIDQDGNLIETKNESGIIGNPINTTKILGYSDPKNSESQPDLMSIADNNDQEFNIVLKKLAPYKVKIDVEYGDGHPSESFSVDIPYGLTSSSAQVDQSILDKLASNDSLDLDKSKAFIQRIASGNPATEGDGFSLSTVISGFNIDGSDFKSIFNGTIDFVNEQVDSAILEGASGQTFDAFEIYFDKYEQSESHNNGGSTVSKEITDINQKSATFGDKETKLYNSNGVLIPNIQLAKNSDWKNDKQMILDGTKYYRVSTDAWVKASDVYVYTDNISKIRVHADNRSRIIRPNGDLSDRALEKSTEWKTDRYTTINGEKYYRVSTEGFVKASEVSEYK